PISKERECIASFSRHSAPKSAAISGILGLQSHLQVAKSLSMTRRDTDLIQGVESGTQTAVDQSRRCFPNVFSPHAPVQVKVACDMRKLIAHVIDDDAAVRDSDQLVVEGSGREVQSYGS